jgi:serine/threonine protein kinase
MFTVSEVVVWLWRVGDPWTLSTRILLRSSYRFMAPEVFRHENYNLMVDVYSYGMIFYHLLVGRPPWPHLAGLDAVRTAAMEGGRPDIPRSIDQRLQNLLKECWDENPNVRPPFDRIIDELARYSKDALKADTNAVLTTSPERSGCNCTIQ